MPVNAGCCAPAFGPSVILYTLRDLTPACVPSGLPSGGSVLPDFSLLNGITFAIHATAIYNAFFYNLVSLQVYTTDCAALTGTRVDFVEIYDTTYAFDPPPDAFNQVEFCAVLRYNDPTNPAIVGYWETPLFAGTTGILPVFPQSGSFANGAGSPAGPAGPFGGTVDFECVFNRYTVTPANQTFSNAAQSGSVAFSWSLGTDQRWFVDKATADSGGDPKDWLTITSATSGTGTSGTVTFTLAANTTGYSRNCQIAVNNAVYTITQNA